MLDILLALRFAIAPFENSSFACAISTLSVSTGTPIASISVTSLPFIIPRIRSMSCIIRSSITSMSVLLAVNGARRLASIKRGFLMKEYPSEITALNLSRCPICILTLLRFAISINLLASSTVRVNGFSMRQWTPASRAFFAGSKCRVAGVAMLTISTFLRSSSIVS